MPGISFFKSSRHKSNFKKILGSFMLHKESSETEMKQDTRIAFNLTAKHLHSILNFNRVDTSTLLKDLCALKCMTGAYEVIFLLGS